MTTPSIYQPSNRSPATQFNFKMVFNKIPEVTYFLQGSPIPGLGFNSIPEQATPYKNVPQSGDKLTYDDFEMKFLIDEDLKTWQTVHDWLVGLGFPQSRKQYGDLVGQDQAAIRRVTSPIVASKLAAMERPPSDGTLIVMNSHNVPVLEVEFNDLIPVRLTGLQYRTTDTEPEYLTATATFKYTIYKLRRISQ